MVIDRMRQSSEMASDEQGDFHGSRGDTDHVFAVRELLKKACEKIGKCL